jgi:oligopeptide transport system substrate-binding protein
MTATVTMLIVLIAGCEDVNPPPNAGDGSSDAPVEFTIANGEIPSSLDPAENSSFPYSRIGDALFDTLVESDPETNEPIPALAESWAVSTDNTTYTFHLREAYFSDGTRITANHVVDSWYRVLEPSNLSPYAWYMEMLIEGAAEYNDGTLTIDDVGITATDTYTVQITTVGPLPYVVSALSHYVFSVVPTHVLSTNPDFWVDPDAFVGSGPFELSEYSAGSSVVVTKSPTYWDESNVDLDSIQFLAAGSSVAEFDAGTVDWLTSVPRDEISNVAGRDEYQNAPHLGTYYYSINVKTTELSDSRVRKALSMAIDRDTLVSSVTQGGQIATASMVPEMAGYPGISGNDYDVAAAQSLLSEAGYPSGADFPSISILYNTSDSHFSVAQYVAQEWEDNLGITSVTFQNLDWHSYLVARRAGDFDVARAGWIGDYRDPNTFLDMFITGSAMNGGGFASSTYDQLITRAATESGATRMATLEEAEELLVTTEQAVIPLYHYVSINMIDTAKWGGWHTNVMDEHPLKFVHRK